MYKLITFIILISLNSLLIAQTKTTTYKDKRGNPIGYSKQNGNKTVYYNKSHNKTGSSKSTNGNTTFYNKQGNKILTSKRK